MKVKVINKFRDKYTGAIMRPGEEMTITQERYEEIMSVGAFVRMTGEKGDSAVSGDDVCKSLDNARDTLKSGSATSGDKLDGMTVRELREYANSRFKVTFSAGMKKSEIIDEIRRMSK